MVPPPDPDPVPDPDPEILAPESGTATRSLRRTALPSALLLTLVPLTAWAQSPDPPAIRLPLAGTAATHFGTTDPAAPEDADLAERLAAAHPSLTWSTCLARAAASFAATTAGHRAESLPPDLLEAVLLHAGCPDPYAEVGTVVGRNTSPVPGVALARELDRAAAQPFTHAGLAFAPEPSGGFRWAVVLSRRLAEVEPFPVHLTAGRVAWLRFKLATGLDQPRLAVILPDGHVERPAVRCTGTTCAAEIAAADQPGALWIQLAARRHGGDVLAAQVRAGVELDPPACWEGLPLADPEPPVTASEGEARLARLVNDERRRHGLAPLVVDPALATAARAHSADMRDAGFFAHRSPTRGDLATRLESAGYPFRAARENIARSDGVAAALAALMASPGHRANLLWPELTHLGVGAVRSDGGDGAGTLVITEIFALPTASLSVVAVRDLMLDRIAEARDRAGMAPLHHDQRLDGWAERMAHQAARRGTLDPESLAELEVELGPPQEGSRTVRVELMSATEPSLLEVPEALTRAGGGAFGIGLDVGGTGEREHAATVVLVVVETLAFPVTDPAP